MSLHVEWDTARECEIDVADRDTVNDPDDGWCLDEDVTAPYVLMLGGAGGGALAIEGTRDQLIRFVKKIHKQVVALPREEEEEEYDHSRAKEDARNGF